MKKIRHYFLAAAVLVAMAACEESEKFSVDLTVSPADLGTLEFCADTVSVTTNAKELTVDSIQVLSATDEGFDLVVTYEFGKTLSSGDSLKADWLKLRFSAPVLDVMTETYPPAKLDTRLYQFKIYVSVGKSSQIIEGMRDGFPLGSIISFTVEPSKIVFGAEGGEVTCQANNANINAFWVGSIEADGETIEINAHTNYFDETIDWLRVWRSRDDDIDIVHISADANQSGKERTFKLICYDVINWSEVTGLQLAE